jgi:glutathione S-transferase
VRKAPKHKLPVLIDGNQTIPDSTFIRWHLEQAHGIDFDRGLSPRSKAIAWAAEKMLEDNLYWAVVDERWQIDENFERGPKLFFASLPQPLRSLAIWIVRRDIARTLQGQGMGRHSRDEICRLAGANLKALSDILGDSKYLMGSEPCGADATAFAFVATVICPVFDTCLKDEVARHANLMRYNERMMGQYFPDLA